jgi:hypothetical protein
MPLHRFDFLDLWWATDNRQFAGAVLVLRSRLSTGLGVQFICLLVCLLTMGEVGWTAIRRKTPRRSPVSNVGRLFFTSLPPVGLAPPGASRRHALA